MFRGNCGLAFLLVAKLRLPGGSIKVESNPADPEGPESQIALARMGINTFVASWVPPDLVYVHQDAAVTV
jgi:hypothetical protein